MLEQKDSPFLHVREWRNGKDEEKLVSVCGYKFFFKDFCDYAPTSGGVEVVAILFSAEEAEKRMTELVAAAERRRQEEKAAEAAFSAASKAAELERQAAAEAAERAAKKAARSAYLALPWWRRLFIRRPPPRAFPAVPARRGRYVPCPCGQANNVSQPCDTCGGWASYEEE